MSKIVGRLRDVFRHINDNRGFTLVELLIVLAIIGILATIAIPSITRAKLTVCHANISAIEAAAGLFYIDNGRYPTNDELNDTGMGAYFKDGKFPKCPLGGTYSIDEKGKVTCNHTTR